MLLRPLTLACLAAAALAGPAFAIDGPALYKENCRKCHGDDGKAHTFRGYLYFAQDLSDPKWQARHNDDELFNYISKGPGMMPAFKKSLSEEERRVLVEVVRSLNARPAP